MCISPWLGDSAGAPPHTPKSYGFSSQSGPIPRLRVQSPVRAHPWDNQLVFLSHIDSPPTPPLVLSTKSINISCAKNLKNLMPILICSRSCWHCWHSSLEVSHSCGGWYPYTPMVPTQAVAFPSESRLALQNPASPLNGVDTKGQAVQTQVQTSTNEGEYLVNSYSSFLVPWRDISACFCAITKEAPMQQNPCDSQRKPTYSLSLYWLSSLPCYTL